MPIPSQSLANYSADFSNIECFYLFLSRARSPPNGIQSGGGALLPRTSLPDNTIKLRMDLNFKYSKPDILCNLPIIIFYACENIFKISALSSQPVGWIFSLPSRAFPRLTAALT